MSCCSHCGGNHSEVTRKNSAGAAAVTVGCGVKERKLWENTTGAAAVTALFD